MSAMKICAFCPNEVSDDDPEAYREVVSWVHGPKLDSPKLRSQTGRIAHKHCVENLAHGQAPDQPELFGEGENESFSSRMGHPGGHYG